MLSATARLNPPPAAAAAAAADLELRLLAVGALSPAELDPSALDQQERARAGALLRLEDRRRHLASHLLLREALARRLGIAAQEVAYVREACPHCGELHGRPALAGPAGAELHFSLSHDGELALVGLASRPIGVDLQAVPSAGSVAELAALLHPRERAELESAPALARAEQLAALWTRKEAYLKGTGAGIAYDLERVYLGEREPARWPSGWTVFNLALPAGYSAAAAVRVEETGSPAR